jgi:hypothetical protein
MTMKNKLMLIITVSKRNSKGTRQLIFFFLFVAPTNVRTCIFLLRRSNSKRIMDGRSTTLRPPALGKQKDGDSPHFTHPGSAFWACACFVNYNYLQNKPHFVWASSILRE